jgi:hypothetical protein
MSSNIEGKVVVITGASSIQKNRSNYDCCRDPQHPGPGLILWGVVRYVGCEGHYLKDHRPAAPRV